MKFTAALFTAVTLATVLVSAHPGEVHEGLSKRELQDATRRGLAARNCDAQIKRWTADRMAKRGMMGKRSLLGRAASCVTPELTEGPYYVNDELVRNDLREDQGGVDLTIDMQVIDLATCEPLTTAFVEIWHANASGFYSGYTGNVNVGSSLTDAGSFLRGGNVVDSTGNLTLETIYPGFYTGRAPHIHMMVHENYDINANGTIASHSGSIIHVGQFFFLEELNEQVFANSPYTSNKNTLMTDDEDSILAQLTSAGYPPYAQTEMIGTNVTDGLIAYVAIVVDTTASTTIANANYAEPFTYSANSTAASSTIAAVANSTSVATSGNVTTTTPSGTATTSSVGSSSNVSATATTAAASASTSSSAASSKNIVGHLLTAVGAFAAAMAL